MRRHVTGIVCLALALFCVAPAAEASGQGAAPGSGVARIGYVDFTKALNEVSDGVAAKKRLKDEFREKQQRLDLMQGELTQMKERLDRDRLVLSAEAVEQREKAYRQKFQDVQSRYADFRREMSQREEHVTEDILDRLRGIVRNIGDQEGYALILEKSQEVVIYAPAAEDLTSRVIQEYNRGGGKKGR
jgi:outer membrane protein